MEFIFSQEDNTFKLPVIPSSFEVQTGNLNSVVTIEGLGEINLIGQAKLAEISINSFFPAQKYCFVQYTDFPSPYECVAIFEKWRNSGKPIRMLITNTTINSLFTIEEFQYGEQDGTHDVYFTLGLKQYRIIGLPNQSVSGVSPNAAADTARPTKTADTTYTVKQGDNLYTIALKVYGDGSKASNIAAKNNLLSWDSINPGQVLQL